MIAELGNEIPVPFCRSLTDRSRGIGYGSNDLQGVSLPVVVAAGIKKNGDPDLGLLVSDRPARVAAVFTQNRVQAAPVQLDRERVKSGTARAVIVNAGNANCANGGRGWPPPGP
jgi:N-acetylglutamate synthase/N-acetylornithine aminotransferase